MVIRILKATKKLLEKAKYMYDRTLCFLSFPFFPLLFLFLFIYKYGLTWKNMSVHVNSYDKIHSSCYCKLILASLGWCRHLFLYISFSFKLAYCTVIFEYRQQSVTHTFGASHVRCERERGKKTWKFQFALVICLTCSFSSRFKLLYEAQY